MNEWYTYVGLFVLAIAACFVIINIRTSQGIKKKRAADRRAAKVARRKSNSAKKKAKR